MRPSIRLPKNRWSLYAVAALALLSTAHNTTAGTLTINLLQANGQQQALSGAVIYAVPDTPVDIAPDTAAVNQQGRQFDPYISVVQRGAAVSFPNNDSVSHHVYSFSKAKAFELPLYKHQQPEPLNFENSGLVVLGCNIHDWMLGYLLVVDTPFFGYLESHRGELSLPPGQYTVNIWHPRLHKSDKPQATIRITQKEQSLNLQLSHALLSPYDREPPNADFGSHEY